jgi:hypothetical protein
VLLESLLSGDDPVENVRRSVLLLQLVFVLHVIR